MLIIFANRLSLFYSLLFGFLVSITSAPLYAQATNSCATPDETELFGLQLLYTGARVGRMLHVTNCGTNLDTFYAAISGEGYSLTQPARAVVKPGSKASFEVSWNATECKGYPGMIFIKNPNGDTLARIPLKGYVVGFEFETTNNPDVVAKKDSTVYYTVTVRNSGFVAARLGKPTVTGPFSVQPFDAADDQISGAVFTIPIAFTPKDTGISTGTLSFPTIKSHVCSIFTIPLQGHTPGSAGSQPGKSAISVSSSLFLDNSFPLGQEVVQPLRVTNVGETNATVRISMTPGEFMLPFHKDTTILPGDSVIYNVRYNNDTCSSALDTLTITNLTDTTSIDAVLAAMRYGSEFSVTGLKTLECYVGDTARLSLTITNKSQDDLVFQQPEVALPFRITGYQGVIPHPLSKSLVLSFIPQEAGTFEKILTFPNVVPRECSPRQFTVRGVAQIKPSDPLGLVRIVTEQNGYILKQNYPNPFNPSTTIPFFLPKDGEVRIELINEKGAIIRTMLRRSMHRGEHSIYLEASDLPSGTYYYALTTNEVRLMRKLNITK